MNWSQILTISLCAAFSVVVISTYAALIPKDSSGNTTLLTVISVFSICASVTAYALALFYFSANPNHMLQFLLAMVLLVCLPASLISTAISTVTISNLRESLATTS